MNPHRTPHHFGLGQQIRCQWIKMSMTNCFNPIIGWYTRWWFGTWILFFHFIYGFILSIDEFIFFKMVIAPPTSIGCEKNQGFVLIFPTLSSVDTRWVVTMAKRHCDVFATKNSCWQSNRIHHPLNFVCPLVNLYITMENCHFYIFNA